MPRRSFTLHLPEGVLAAGLLLVAAATLALEPLLRGLSRALAPIAGDLPDTASSDPTTPLALASITATVFVPLLIALLAVAIAWPTAWYLRALDPRRRIAACALLITPLLMPMYLAYAGWGLVIRGPGTAVNLFLAQWPDLLTALGPILAILALALWCWPVATFVLAPSVLAMPQDELDALTLTGAGPLARTRQHLRRHAVPLLAAVALCTLLMLGSVVPLHLAQVQTLAIAVWAELALRPDAGAAWRASLPLLVLAIIAALLITRALRIGPHASDSPSPPAHPSSLRRCVAPSLLTVYFLATLGPLLCFLWAIRSWPGMFATWREALPALNQSLSVGALVGLAMVLMTLAAIRAAEAGGVPARIARLALALLTITAILPGVLVASASPGQIALQTLDALTAPLLGTDFALLGRDLLPVVLGHAARFGVLAVGLGLVLGSAMPRELTFARRGLAGPRLWPWLRTLGATHAPLAMISLFFASVALSLHEIEATIILRPPLPPGTRPIAQLMLDSLHMNSLQELASVGVLVVGTTLVLSIIAAALIIRLIHRKQGGT
jgi:ABC-type Fe3+ transport system permease subunit